MAQAQRMAGLVRQFADGARDGGNDLPRGRARCDLIESDIAQRLDFAGNGLGDSRLHLVALDHPCDLRQHVVEQGLMTAVGRQRIHPLAEEAGEVDLRQSSRRATGQKGPHAFIVEGGKPVARHRHRVVAQ